YTYGYGRLSLYAHNGQIDAWGNYREFYVGGASLNAATDVTGPEIELFVDDFNFVSGGLTDNTPLLLARVYDEHGINTSGIGIGRDIVAIIDKGTVNEKRFVLNAFYSAKLNSYTTGDIRYQLEGIADGVHTYTLKVWDVYNNSSEATIEFVVRNNEDLKLEHVLNYPNPFSTNTEFHFDHNQAGQNLKVIITIMTITGKVMKTIEEDIPNAPGHVSQIMWNGRDEYDDKPSKGVYIYKITVMTDDGKKAEIIEKLVILN
ncbi:MAG: T9SS type A sorting domain-containing protein, partial [Bacteroidetes bacterium]|nr:T9SS type A sorting domain-containing protein [Bacteroidota bacterium]